MNIKLQLMKFRPQRAQSSRAHSFLCVPPWLAKVVGPIRLEVQP